MNAQTQTKPTPTVRSTPLSAEDRAIIEHLELLEELELLDSWNTDQQIELPELEESESK